MIRNPNKTDTIVLKGSVCSLGYLHVSLKIYKSTLLLQIVPDSSMER
jgi:hypothetical protein